MLVGPKGRRLDGNTAPAGPGGPGASRAGSPPPPTDRRTPAMAAAGLQGYLDQLRAALRPALCLHNYPSETVERHNKPVIEIAEPCSLLVLPPVTVSRSPQVRSVLVVPWCFASFRSKIEKCQ